MRPQSFWRATLPCCGLLALLGTTACSFLTRPNPDRALLDESRVVHQLDRDKKQGELLLTEEGLWGLVEPKKITPKTGQLIALTQPERPDDPTQLFAVVSTHDWGAMLQRLTRSPFTPTEAYTLEVIEPEELSIAEHGAILCPSREACKNHTPQHLTYNLDSNNLLPPSHHPREDHYLFPIKPTWTSPRAPYLVITHDPGPAPGFIASVSDTCASSLVEALNLPDTVEVRTHTTPSHDLSSHPIRVEQLATSQGADVLLHCPSSDEVLVATPSLARPWLPSRHARLDSPGPALLGAAPLRIDTREMPPAQLGLLVSAAGWIARGAYAPAALHIEQALADDTFTRQRDRIAMPLAQVIALDAPELAVHIAHQATRQAWRRDEVLAHNIVMLAVWNALNQRGAIGTLEKSLPERTSRQTESALGGWMTWRGLSQAIEARELRTVQEVRSASKSFQAEEFDAEAWRWMTLMSLLLGPALPDEKELQKLEGVLELDAKELDAGDVILTYKGSRDGQWGCDETPADRICLPDLYGMRTKAILTRPRAVEALSTVPQRPPYMLARSWGRPEDLSATLELVWARLEALRPRRAVIDVAIELGKRAAMNQPPYRAEEIQHILTSVTRLDAPDSRDYRRLALVLESLLATLEHDADTPLTQTYADVVESLDEDDASLAHIYWYHVLLASSSEETLRDRIAMLLAKGHRDVKQAALTCAGTWSAQALVFLQENRTIQAREAYREIEQCDLDALTAEQRLDVELIDVILTHQETGSLPTKLSPKMVEKIENHRTIYDGEVCMPAWPQTPFFRAWLGEPLRSVAAQLGPIRDAAMASTSEELSLVPMNAYSKHMLAKERMLLARVQFDQGDIAQALSTLEQALSDARDARAWYLTRQIDFAILVLEELLPGGNDAQEEKEASATTPMSEEERAHQAALVEVMKSLLLGPEISTQALVRKMPAALLEHEAIKVMCTP